VSLEFVLEYDSIGDLRRAIAERKIESVGYPSLTNSPNDSTRATGCALLR
jgi:hypothetical protein